VLSEANLTQQAHAFRLIADLAPTLKEGELRVLIALSSLFATTEHRSGRISASNLAKAAKLTEPNVRKAIDSLEQRSLIAKRKGTATEPSGYGLIFLNITKMPERGGSFKDPPSIEERAQAGASIDSIKPDSIIDRLLKAKPKNFDPVEIEEARAWVHGYQAKLGKNKNPHPPDDTILCQIITALGWEDEFRCEDVENLADFKALIVEVSAIDPDFHAFRWGPRGSGHRKPAPPWRALVRRR